MVVFVSLTLTLPEWLCTYCFILVRILSYFGFVCEQSMDKHCCCYVIAVDLCLSQWMEKPVGLFEFKTKKWCQCIKFTKCIKFILGTTRTYSACNRNAWHLNFLISDYRKHASLTIPLRLCSFGMSKLKALLT